jgi:hypothetical protein
MQVLLRCEPTAAAVASAVPVVGMAAFSWCLLVRLLLLMLLLIVTSSSAAPLGWVIDVHSYACLVSSSVLQTHVDAIRLHCSVVFTAGMTAPRIGKVQMDAAVRLILHMLTRLHTVVQGVLLMLVVGSIPTSSTLCSVVVLTVISSGSEAISAPPQRQCWFWGDVIILVCSRRCVSVLRSMLVADFNR